MIRDGDGDGDGDEADSIAACLSSSWTDVFVAADRLLERTMRRAFWQADCLDNRKDVRRYVLRHSTVIL